MAISDNQWRLLKVSDSQWRSVTVSDDQWWSVTVSDDQWWSMTISDGQWRSVTVSEGQWRSLTVSDGQWRSVLVSDGQWRSDLSDLLQFHLSEKICMTKLDINLFFISMDMPCQSYRGLFLLLWLWWRVQRDPALGQFVVLWDKGKVGGEEEVAAECVVCMYVLRNKF